MSFLPIVPLLLLGCDTTEDEKPTTDTVEDTGAPDTGTLDTEPEPEPEPETDPSMGEDDDFASAACALREEEPTELVLAATAEEAAQQTVVADGTPLRLVMPEEGDGWMILEIPDWMAYVRIFTDEGVEYDIDGGEPITEKLTNGACPQEGLSDQFWAFHEWGAYPVHFAEGTDQIWLVAIEE